MTRNRAANHPVAVLQNIMLFNQLITEIAMERMRSFCGNINIIFVMVITLLHKMFCINKCDKK